MPLNTVIHCPYCGKAFWTTAPDPPPPPKGFWGKLFHRNPCHLVTCPHCKQEKKGFLTRSIEQTYICVCTTPSGRIYIKCWKRTSVRVSESFCYDPFC